MSDMHQYLELHIPARRQDQGGLVFRLANGRSYTNQPDFEDVSLQGSVKITSKLRVSHWASTLRQRLALIQHSLAQIRAE